MEAVLLTVLIVIGVGLGAAVIAMMKLLAALHRKSTAQPHTHSIPIFRTPSARPCPSPADNPRNHYTQAVQYQSRGKRCWNKWNK